MAHEATKSKKLVGLPLSVVGPVDVGRLIRELEAINNTLLEQGLRKEKLDPGLVSRVMTQTIELNKLEIIDKADRALLAQLLLGVRDKAPVLHISFSADPTPEFTKAIMTYLRREIHPLVLMTIGLQPNIGAGCIVRSTNHYFDFSLRQNFMSKRSLLLETLKRTEADDKAEAATAVKEPAA